MIKKKPVRKLEAVCKDKNINPSKIRVGLI